MAAVTGGFPRPLADRGARLAKIRTTAESGAHEIDVVITLSYATKADWAALYDEVRGMRDACGRAHLKTILVAGEMDSLDTVAQAGLVCCMAGADFIKTSTGRDRVNATLPIGMAMCGALRIYSERTGFAVGLKPAGGIRTDEQALSWVRLVEEQLGAAWVTPHLLRIGASSLLDDVARRMTDSAQE